MPITLYYPDLVEIPVSLEQKENFALCSLGIRLERVGLAEGSRRFLPWLVQMLHQVMILTLARPLSWSGYCITFGSL